MRFDDDEPVFKRSRWGTNRYVYNPHNPIGLALIVLSIALVAMMLLLMRFRAGPFAPPSDTSPTSWDSPSQTPPWAPPVEESPGP